MSWDSDNMPRGWLLKPQKTDQLILHEVKGVRTIVTNTGKRSQKIERNMNTKKIHYLIVENSNVDYIFGESEEIRPAENLSGIWLL